ncbi:hypothetical protein EV644_107242 [Kribbella orskensis]|uniref:Uncharacterized protein n=1 Tax=Kribbella orskensis TaxID=2512216 RepID=A0ABY2BJA8_9ACTN|nr:MULTISPECIES: hypothetical protein [Kribbella]TCN39272.1 hypothetical protein EV642_107242 [Kribbella sp. VKM Ac-2500]TCO21919.1 hypothetical protein EV644_107242 [Kribbella orskensis]
MKVVLLSTRQLSPAYFDTVRADLGGRPDVGLDVVAWVPPAGPVDGLVEGFTLIGPGEMPVETVPPAVPADSVSTPAADAEAVPADVSEAAKAPAPEAATDTEAAAESVADTEAASEPKPAPASAKPRPTGSKHVVKAAHWRYRQLRRAGGKVLPKSIKKAAPIRKLTANRRGNELSKNYWTRVQGRPDVMKVVEQADLVIALDAGSIWAGWQLGQRRTDTPVVLGLPAARRELDRLVGAGNG